MQRIHVIGGKNHGKTTLVVELVEQLTAMGVRVATIKHTHHRHELDTPGKDSFRHRQAGANMVGVLSGGLNAVYWPPDVSVAGDARYEPFMSMMRDMDVVLVEGDTQTAGTKLEVWRAEMGTRPLALRDPSIVAVVTDDPLTIDCHVWPRSDVPGLARRIAERQLGAG